MDIRGTAGVWAMWMLALGCAADDAGDSIGGSGESSGGADSSSGDPPQASVLEQCDAPTPCDPVSGDPGTNFEAVNPALECAVSQALDTIANGTAAELTASYCDIGCSGSDLLLVGDGTAYRQSWSTTDLQRFEEIQRCTLQPAAFFEACQGQPWNTNGCSNHSDWVTGCEVVADAQCP